MKILIEKEISAEVFMLMMEIGKATERKDIISVVKLASEHGGELSPEILCQELLNDRPENVGRTILNRCCDERLMEWIDIGTTARLTRDGEDSAETGITYQKMRDIYEIIYYDKGLLPCLIGCKGTGQSEFNQKSSFKEYEVNSDVKNNLTQEISFTLPETKESIKVYSIERKGARSEIGKKIKIFYNLSDDGHNELTLSGDAKGQYSDLEYSFDEGFKSILKSLGRSKDWDSKNGSLKVSFTDLTSDKEKRNFIQDFSEKKVVENYFCEEALDKVTLKEVPVFPRTPNDAQEWFVWLLKNEINDYLEEEQYKEYSEKILQRFGHFADVLEVPESRDLAEIIKRESAGKFPDKYWYLVAPLDLKSIAGDKRKITEVW